MDSQTAFKASFTKDTTFNFNPHAFLDELSTLNLQNATPSDDFFVEELLDFSHHQQEQEEEDEPKNKNDSVSVSLSPQQTTQSRHFCNLPSTFSLKDDFVSTELTVPAEDEADLEWLSHFVEDSFLEHPSAYPTGTTSSDKPQNGFRPQTPVSTRQPCFEAPVPAKARSKRTRSGVRVWPLGSPSFTDSSSSNSSSSSSSPSSPCLIYTGLTQNLEPVSSPAAKKWKRRTAAEAAATAPRRCSHCGVQKTPQWRTGPLGAKTLCNACGVRFKSGRLLPEYRPACSPTFSSELHSNHHRKVLEMRRKKEVGGAIGLGSDHFPVVPSF